MGMFYQIGNIKRENGNFKKSLWYRYTKLYRFFGPLGKWVVNRKLKNKFDKTIEEIDKIYRIDDSSTVYVFASSPTEAIRKIKNDEELIRLVYGISLAGEPKVLSYKI